MVNGFTDIYAVDAVSNIQIAPKTKDKSQEERKKDFVAKKRNKPIAHSDEKVDIRFTTTTYTKKCVKKIFSYDSKEYNL